MVMCHGSKGKVGKSKPREGCQGSGGVKFMAVEAIRRAGEE